MTTTEDRAEAHAAHMREQSEQMIRRSAARQAIADAGRYPTTEQRRDALLELAESVAAEQGRACRPITLVVPLIVPTLAAASVMNVLAEFDELVVAVVDRARFVADPDVWLASNGLSLASVVYDGQDEATAGAVDSALDVLMGKSSAVAR